MRFPYTLRYTSGIVFYCLENYYIWQPFGPSGDGYRNFTAYSCNMGHWKRGFESLPNTQRKIYTLHSQPDYCAYWQEWGINFVKPLEVPC
jgi:hypothetical protein